MAYPYPSGGYPPSNGVPASGYQQYPSSSSTPSPYYAAPPTAASGPPPAGYHTGGGGGYAAPPTPAAPTGYAAPYPGGGYGASNGYSHNTGGGGAPVGGGYGNAHSPYGGAPSVPAKVADGGAAYTHPAQRRPAMPVASPSPVAAAPVPPGHSYPSYPSTFAASPSPYAPAPAPAVAAGGYGGGYGGGGVASGGYMGDPLAPRFPEEPQLPDYHDFEGGQSIAPPPLPGQLRAPNMPSMPPMPTPGGHHGGGGYGYPPMPAPSPSSSSYQPMPSPAAPQPPPMPVPSPSSSASLSSSTGGLGGAAPGLDRPFVLPDYIRPVHPKYLSMTVQAWPSSSALRLRSNLSFGLVIRPLATPPSGESPPPVINFGSVGVVRCVACRAYINPFVQFFEGGAKWRCNICGRHNQVPPGYFAPLGRDGRRADLADRPELVDAAVEIVAPAEYMVRPPMPPVFVFVIDVSVASIKSGMLPLLCATIRKLLPRLPGDKRTMVGFVTYDSTIHFYSLRPGAEKPQMFVESDLADIFLPVPDHLLVNLDESRSQVEALLDSLSRMHAKTEDVEAATGPALDAALKLMGRLGGKLLLFSSGLPSIGDGRLGNRENPRLLNSDKEQTMLVPASDFYKQLAIKLTRYQIGVDVFLFSDAYTDVASMNDLAHHTGGQCLYYPSFTATVSANRFKRELTRCLTRLQGWESVVRIRSSKGSVLQNFYGNFYLRGADLLALPCIDCDKAYAVEMKNDETVMTTNSVSVQSALLYTTSSGERRIRVHNVCIPVSSALHELYQATNVNAMTNLLAKQAVDMALAQTLAKARDALRVKCVSIMRTYRSTIATGTKTGPDYTLSTLPLMTLGLIKSTCLKEGNDVRVDQRASAMAALATMGIVEFETYVRPRMIPIHEMKDSQGFKDEKGSVELPPEVPLSAEQLKPDSVYLIDNGFNFFIRIGRAVSPYLLTEAFGVASFDELDPRSARLRRADANDTKSVARRLANIITYLRSISPYYQEVVIVKEGDAAEIRFINQLIEDRNMSAMSLAEFNNHILRGSGPNASAY